MDCRESKHRHPGRLTARLLVTLIWTKSDTNVANTSGTWSVGRTLDSAYVLLSTDRSSDIDLRNHFCDSWTKTPLASASATDDLLHITRNSTRDLGTQHQDVERCLHLRHDGQDTEMTSGQSLASLAT